MLSSSVTNSPVKSNHLDSNSNSVDNSNSRLIVDHIVLENFKSYAGRQVIGPFHQNFTSIVGPNGSGKSNVIDAFMFVLGYRAKKLRQGKLSELIHNSEELMNFDHCTVEVHFKLISDNPEVEDKNLTVSRTAFRNNSNKYQINGQTSNYSDVTSLLKGFGVDLDHKRFLILQGEVESIAQMKPKGSNEHEEGLLEYLEDLIGTNKYIEMIETTGKAVDEANDACAEKNVRVKAAEKEVLALKEDKIEAENFIRKENGLTMKKGEFYQIIHFDAKNQIQKLNDKFEEFKEKLAVETDKNEEKVSQVTQIDQKLKEIFKSRSEAESRLSASLKRTSVLEKDEIKLQETKKHLKAKAKGLLKTISEETKNRTGAEQEIVEIVQEMEIIRVNVKKLEGELRTEEVELENATKSLQGKTGDFQHQLESLQKQLSPWTEKIQMEQDALEGAVLALSAFEKKQRIQGNELSDAETQLQSTRREFDEATKRRTELIEERTVLKSESDRLASEIAAGEEISTALSGEINSIQSTLSEANESLRQNNNGNAALSALMKESSSGRIKGVFGRLGDLGIIDSKYDCAISTACSSLNFIVVDTTASGQKCVEFLRKNNLGRASFIILEKMKGSHSWTGSNQLPSGSVRLFDLVQAKDKQFLPAFYYALNDTLVANSMDEASKLAYGSGPNGRRFRVVTLDGKLYDTSGTMSGGGNSHQQGGMKASFTPEISREQLSQLNNLLTEKLAEHKTVKVGLSKYQELLSKCKIDVKRLDMELGKLEIALKSLPTQISDLEESIRLIRAKDWKPTREDLEKIDRLKAQVIQYESNIQELKSECTLIQGSIDTCQGNILEAGGTRFKAQRSKVNDLKDQIKLQERRISKLSNQKTVLDKKLLSSSSNTTDSSEIDGINAEIEEIEKNIETLVADLNASKKDHTRIEEELRDFDEKIGTLKKEIESLSKELSKFRKFEFELKSEIEKITGMREKEIKRSTWSHEQFINLKLNPIRIDDEIEQEIPLLDYDHYSSDINTRDYHDLEHEIKKLEGELNALQPNLKVIEEYRERNRVFQSIRDEYIQLETQRDLNRETYESLRKRRHDEFMTGFRQISLRLKELYQLITMGGNAELELVDSLDPFAEGILFSVMPPKKSWKNISNLSGGEKTLSSLALVFALHTFKPTPIYVMDEIDAALDFKNVSIVANYIKDRTKDAQFIVISLRNNMFELADRLVGIYKTNQKTKSVTINPKTFCVGSFIKGESGGL